MGAQYYRAIYEDAAKTEAAARKEGYDGNNGSLMDYVEPYDYCTGKTFKTLAEAESWLQTQINGMKTVFGCGTIRLREPVERPCRYCTCGGVRTLHEYTVDDTGIVEEAAVEECCGD